MIKSLPILFLTALLNASAQTKAPEDYAPLLPSVKAKIWKIDPKLGYAVKNIGNGVYVISDDM